MNPVIYSATEIEFLTRGYGTLSDCISCTVTEILNGEYTLELRYPKNGIHQEFLQVRNIIVCQPNHTKEREAFRIYKVNRSLTETIVVYARQLAYDLSYIMVEPCEAQNSLSLAIGILVEAIYNAYDSLRFSITYDTNKSGSFSIPMLSSVRSWFGGREGSLIDVYGGEWNYDFFTCNLSTHRGEDNGVRLSYGVNLAKYIKEINDVAYSAVRPYFAKTDQDTVVTIAGDETATSYTDTVKVLALDISDKVSQDYGKVVTPYKPSQDYNAETWVVSGTPSAPIDRGKRLFSDKDELWMNGSTQSAMPNISPSIIYVGTYASNPLRTMNANNGSFTLWTGEIAQLWVVNALSVISGSAGYGFSAPFSVVSGINYHISGKAVSHTLVTLSFLGQGGNIISTTTVCDGTQTETVSLDFDAVVPTNALFGMINIASANGSDTGRVSDLLICSRPTVAEVTALGATYVSEHSEVATDNMTISVSPEVVGEEISMGDTVHVCYDDAVVDSRVVKTVWDSLAERYTGLEIGTLKENIAATIKNLK